MLDAYKQVGDTIRHAPPFAAPGTFFRGNLHTHTTASDGDFPAEEVVRRYQDQGYDFLCLSDHFLECYEYPVTDSREFRSSNFTTLIAAELHAVCNAELPPGCDPIPNPSPSPNPITNPNLNFNPSPNPNPTPTPNPNPSPGTTSAPRTDGRWSGWGMPS